MTTLKFISHRKSLYTKKNPLSQALFPKNTLNLQKLSIFAHSSMNSINETAKDIQKDGSSKFSQNKSNNSYQKDPVVDKEVPKFIAFSANRNFLNEEISISPLPPLPSVNDPNFEKILREKMQLCSIIFNFSNPRIQIEGKRSKLNVLIELNRLLLKDSEIVLITETQKDLIFDMLSKNIFEQDPFISKDLASLSTLNPSIIEPSWEHMCHVYQALIQFLIIFPEKCQIDHVKNIIRLLNIPDSNERENLMTLLQDYVSSHQNQREEIF